MIIETLGEKNLFEFNGQGVTIFEPYCPFFSYVSSIAFYISVGMDISSTFILSSQ